MESKSSNPNHNIQAGSGTLEETLPALVAALVEAVSHLSSLAGDVRRIANTVDPPPSDKVDSGYVADRLGCTTTWIADMVRRGQIPKNAIVAGTGNGKPWKFHRAIIEKWIDSR